MKNDLAPFEAAANYESLNLCAKWDYCWEADLAQEDWEERCRVLPANSEYLIDLQCILLDMHL